MIAADAFKIGRVHMKEHPSYCNEHFVEDLIKGYELRCTAMKSVSYSTVDSEEISFKNMGELQIMRRAPYILLNESLDKLAILRVMMIEKVDKVWYNNVRYRPPEERFTGEDESEFALYEYTNSRKLTKNICFIHNILYNALMELERFRNVNLFLQTMKVVETEVEDADNLSFAFVSNIQRLTNVSRELRDSYRKNQQIYNRKLEDIFRVKQAYENLVLYSDIKLRHNHNWERDRCYLSKFRNTGREREVTTYVAEYSQKIMSENRIHDEISTFLTETANDHNFKIDEWMENYDQELERLDGKIFEIKVDREKWEMEFKLLNKEYNGRSEEIRKWLELKEKMRYEAELAAKLTAAAMKVQAWWRGVMVRRHLGHYRKKKKGKGKKDKGKKKRK